MTHPRHQYPRETAVLQDLARSCGLLEKIRWGKPCFVSEDRNIVLLQPFKEYIALLFFKGALLNDPEKLLYRVGAMEAPRQLRFRSLEEIERHSSAVRAYIAQAVAIEHSGAKVKVKKAADLEMPEELRTKLDADPALREAFDGLTPGRRKGYIYQIAAAKQAATRVARVDRYTPKIRAGKGVND